MKTIWIILWVSSRPFVADNEDHLKVSAREETETGGVEYA